MLSRMANVTIIEQGGGMTEDDLAGLITPCFLHQCWSCWVKEGL